MTDENPLASIFNQMEASIGTEAYQQNLKMGEAQVRRLDAETSMTEAAIKSVNAKNEALRHLVVLVVMLLLPIYVMLLIYLFKMWVL